MRQAAAQPAGTPVHCQHTRDPASPGFNSRGAQALTFLLLPPLLLTAARCVHRACAACCVGTAPRPAVLPPSPGSPPLPLGGARSSSSSSSSFLVLFCTALPHVPRASPSSPTDPLHLSAPAADRPVSSAPVDVFLTSDHPRQHNPFSHPASRLPAMPRGATWAQF